jgi:surfactin synthase thioesterase subunit
MSNSFAKPNRWLAYRVTRPEVRLRLFCFPYAGGGASIYRGWQTVLPPEIEVCPVQLPGREIRFRETPYTNLEDLLPDLAAALFPYLDLPFALFGHSMGALIAFEFARYLQQRNKLIPVRLFVSGRKAPQFEDTGEAVYRLSDTDFISHLRQLNGTPEEILQNKDLMELVLPTLRADFELCDLYRFSPGQFLVNPITAFGGTADPNTTLTELEGWQTQTTGPFNLRLFNGDHFFINSAQAELLEALHVNLSGY